jgi:hypothetical protein
MGNTLQNVILKSFAPSLETIVILHQKATGRQMAAISKNEAHPT